MRKLLTGLAVGFLVVCIPATAFAAASGVTQTKAQASVKIEEEAKAAGLDTKVVECLKHAAAKNDTEACITSPSPIMPATNEIIWGGLSFILLFLVMAKFGVPAAKGMMDARTDRIRNSLDEADRAKLDAESVLGEYQRQLSDARTESARIIEEARAQAEQVRRDLIARAEAEAAELRQRNAEQVGAERDRVMGELQGQVSELAIELAGKVVERNLDRDTNLQLIESYISSVGSR
jgi:F-type H+-transporting ATPase subunit b